MAKPRMDMSRVFHADESMPGFDGEHPRVGFVDSRPYTAQERAMLMHTSDYKPCDFDHYRLDGRYACPVCGMRHRLKREAVACCEGLTPGLAANHEGRSVHCGEVARRGSKQVP